MSAKGERARRRIREQERGASAAAARQRVETRARTRREALGRVRGALPHRVRVGRAGGVLARRRRLRALAVLGAEVVAVLVVCALVDDPLVRVTAVVVAVVALPVLLTLVSDRRT